MRLGYLVSLFVWIYKHKIILFLLVFLLLVFISEAIRWNGQGETGVRLPELKKKKKSWQSPSSVCDLVVSSARWGVIPQKMVVRIKWNNTWNQAIT